LVLVIFLKQSKEILNFFLNLHQNSYACITNFLKKISKQKNYDDMNAVTMISTLLKKTKEQMLCIMSLHKRTEEPEKQLSGKNHEKKK